MTAKRKASDRQVALHQIDDCLNRLRRAQASRRFGRENAERAQVFLPALALSILSELHRHGPRRLKTLAERIDVDVPQVSRTVKELIGSGHVVLTVDVADGRARVVQLTPLGAKDWTSYRSAARAALADVVRDWDDGDLVEFAGLFTKFLG